LPGVERAMMDALSHFSGPVILALALILDLSFGEPPNAFHPVVWMGNLIALMMKAPVYADHSRGRSPALQFAYGVLVVLATAGVFGGAAYLLLSWMRDWSVIAYILTGAVLLKLSLSVRGLRVAAVKVRDLLASGKLPEARSAVKALVGRDTAQLDAGQVVSATVESVGENTCDSLVAPVFYFLFFGVPGAVVYRAINTLDNSIGYRGKYEYLGKFAARLDDVANFIPARLTAALFVCAAWLCRQDAGNAWRTMFRDHRRTASPNGGWSMGAMAGALGVRLEKAGYYVLGEARKPLFPGTIDASVTVMMVSVLIWALVIAGIQAGWYAAT
jgi:adenosylcobinamide-phosphate synthase